jgi:hypothetical protein
LNVRLTPGGMRVGRVEPAGSATVLGRTQIPAVAC